MQGDWLDWAIYWPWLIDWPTDKAIIAISYTIIAAFLNLNQILNYQWLQIKFVQITHYKQMIVGDNWIN